MTLGYVSNINLGDPQTIDIDSVKPHPQNPRKHRIEMIARAIGQFGQRSPIVVQRSTRLILKGNGTWQAAKHLGWDKIAVVWSDLEGDEALAYMLADNRPSDLATYDRKKARDLLAQMIAGPGLNTTLWDEDEFEDLDEEVRGVATLPEKGTTKTATAEAVQEGDKPQADPARKMREVPLVLTAAGHALFSEYLSFLSTRFGIESKQDTIMEAMRRQYVAEGGGHLQTGPVAPEQVPGQTGLIETIEEQGGAVFSDDLGQPPEAERSPDIEPKPEPEVVYATPGEPVAYRTEPEARDYGAEEFIRKAEAAAAAQAEQDAGKVAPPDHDWPF